MRRFLVLVSILLSFSIHSYAVEAPATGPAESIQKEYPLIPDQYTTPALDEGSYSPRDEAPLRNVDSTQRVRDLLKALIIVGILFSIFCIFAITGSSDVKWEKKIAKENIPSDQ